MCLTVKSKWKNIHVNALCKLYTYHPFELSNKKFYIFDQKDLSHKLFFSPCTIPTKQNSVSQISREKQKPETASWTREENSFVRFG